MLKYNSRIFRFLLFYLALFFIALGLKAALFSPPRVFGAQEESQFFVETGRSLSGKFLSYWRANGGLEIYGFPISEAQPENDPETGKTFLTQWFERARFELHPENAGTKYEILLGLLGKQLGTTRQQSLPFQPTNPSNQASNTYFPEVGHNLGRVFKTYWLQHGGLAQFGYPISEEFQEQNPEDGQTYTVQYFERNRFEYHPEFAGTKYEVLLGLLGKQFWGQLAYQSRLTGNPQSTVSVATDRQNNIYVLDAELRHVIKYSPNWRKLAEWGGWGDNPGQFQNPRGIAVDRQGNVFVADRFLITKFNSQGQVAARWGSFGKGNGQFIGARSIAIDVNGNVFIADNGNHRVQKFDNNGKFLSTWGSQGSGNGQFSTGDARLHVGGPADLAVDEQGNVYVTDDASDTTRSSIQKFDNNGKFLVKWNTPVPLALGVDQEGYVYLGGIAPNGIVFNKYHTNGQLIFEAGKQLFGLGSISGIAVDPQNNILIASLFSGTVQKYSQR